MWGTVYMYVYNDASSYGPRSLGCIIFLLADNFVDIRMDKSTEKK